MRKTVFGIKAADRFQKDEIDAILSYLAGPDIIDRTPVQPAAKAVDTFSKEAYCIDTYKSREKNERNKSDNR